jgi:hypothetical protein
MTRPSHVVSNINVVPLLESLHSNPSGIGKWTSTPAIKKIAVQHGGVEALRFEISDDISFFAVPFFF